MLAVLMVAVIGGGTYVILNSGGGSSYQPRSLPVTAPSVTPHIPGAASPKVAAAIARSVPVRLVIPSIGVDAPVIPEGTDSAGALQVPPLSGPQASDAGWWDGGFTPGQNGPAVLAGHIDSAAMGPLVFWNLHKLVAGQTAEVVLADGAQVWFTVTMTQEVSKAAFPTQAVYGPTQGPALRLITCGGDFNPQTGHYDSNLIVYATEAVPSG